MTAASRDGWGAAVALDDVSGEVALVGIGESPHTGPSGRTAREIARDAIERAIVDAGLAPRDIDGLMYARSDGYTAQYFFEDFGFTPRWVSAEGGGLCWAATCAHDAAVALRERSATNIVNVFAVDWATRRPVMTGGPGQAHADDLVKRHLEIPFGWFPQPVYFATIANRHMAQFGTTSEQLGAVAVACRRHANHTPGAVMHDRLLSLEQYMASPLIADPFRKEDCCLISDGGGAFVMTSVERARDLRSPVVEVAGVGLGVARTGNHWAQQPDLMTTAQRFAAPDAFAMAGIRPQDVDVLACYDPFTILSIIQIEDMGFCAKGEGGPFVAGNTLDFDSGSLPYNTHGGLLSHSYVLGIAHVLELVRQLRHDAGAQVDGAEIAVYGGYTAGRAATMVLRRAR
ncbi:MAG: thiolase family protein [Actinobacteria bacterium]|nr:MAG: thiolase family protein [Actinomycetota bacterium]